MRFGKTACQDAAYLAAICDLKLRFRATTGGKGAIWEIAQLKRCNFAFGRPLPKGPSHTKFTTDSKFTIRSKFATSIAKHYGGHFETTIFKGKLSSKSLQIVKNYGGSGALRG